MIADHRRENRNESNIVVYKPSDSFFIDWSDIVSLHVGSDNVNQRIVNNQLMSDIIGAKHCNEVLHTRCLWTIRLVFDLEIPLELQRRGKVLPPGFQILSQCICQITVEYLLFVRCFANSLILAKFRRGVRFRVSFARARTLRTAKSLIKYWSSWEHKGSSWGPRMNSYSSRRVPGSRLWTRNSLMSVHKTKETRFNEINDHKGPTCWNFRECRNIPFVTTFRAAKRRGTQKEWIEASSMPCK